MVMDLRAFLIVGVMLVCFLAHAQEPQLILRAAFDGDCALQPGGQGQPLAPEFVPGRAGQAVRASAADQMAVAVPIGQLNRDEGTLMFWIKTDSPRPAAGTQGQRARVITTPEGAGPEVTVVRTHHEAQIAFGDPWDAKGSGGARAVLGYLREGKWYHIACTWHRQRADLCLWLFGDPYADTLGKGTGGQIADTNWAHTLQVGTAEFAVDDLRIYDRAMTGEQIIAAAGYGDGECMADEGKVYFDTILDTAAIKGQLLYEDTFDAPWQERWALEGPGIITQEGGRLRIQEPAAGTPGANHVVLWCRQDFPKDFVAEWEFTPNQVAGLCIVFFCARGRDGRDILDPSMPPRDGTFTQYHSGEMNCYHISYFRNTCARAPDCALRKNFGFYRCSDGADYIPLQAGVTSRVTLVKRGAHIQFAINDRVSLDWVDDGVTRGPIWGAGKIGLRQMINTDAWYDNFRVWEVRPR